jgi:hypothetical protein
MYYGGEEGGRGFFFQKVTQIAIYKSLLLPPFEYTYMVYDDIIKRIVLCYPKDNNIDKSS